MLYKKAAKARPAAPRMKGAAVWIAPESPDEVPDSDSELELEPEPEAVAAASDAVEAAEPPAEMADWLTSESSWTFSQSFVHFGLVLIVDTYSTARGRGGGLAEEARDSRTAG